MPPSSPPSSPPPPSPLGPPHPKIHPPRPQPPPPPAAAAVPVAPPITVTPLPDASQSAAPPLDKNGNFKISPKTSWADVPPSPSKKAPPAAHSPPSPSNPKNTKLYPGVNGSYVATSGLRPRRLHPRQGAPSDGRSRRPRRCRHPDATHRRPRQMIAEHRLPAMVAIMVANGGGDGGGSERGLEYDTVSGKFAEYIEARNPPARRKECQRHTSPKTPTPA